MKTAAKDSPMADIAQEPRRIQFPIRMSDGLHAALTVAAQHLSGPPDLSQIVRSAIRFTYPAVNDTFVSKKIDKGRKPHIFMVAPRDKLNVERLAKARYDASKGGDNPGFKENSSSDVVSECVRRYLVQFKDAWGLNNQNHIKAIHLTEPTWPPMTLITLFDEHSIPPEVFSLLKRYYLRQDGPNTLPELLRLVRAKFGAKSGVVAGPVQAAPPTDAQIVNAAIDLLKENAVMWGIA